jgi:hypothetical protein
MLQVANCLSPSAAKNDNESCLCVGDLHRAGEGEDILNIIMNEESKWPLAVWLGRNVGWREVACTVQISADLISYMHELYTYLSRSPLLTCPCTCLPQRIFSFSIRTWDIGVMQVAAIAASCRPPALRSHMSSPEDHMVECEKQFMMSSGSFAEESRQDDLSGCDSVHY